MMLEILLGPTYSRIVLTWSAVGGFSVTSSSNSSGRLACVCAVWSLAWSSVAPAAELADTCLSRLATLCEAGEPALEKRVMMSRVLCCWGVNRAVSEVLGAVGGTDHAEHFGGVYCRMEGMTVCRLTIVGWTEAVDVDGGAPPALQSTGALRHQANAGPSPSPQLSSADATSPAAVVSPVPIIGGIVLLRSNNAPDHPAGQRSNLRLWISLSPPIGAKNSMATCTLSFWQGPYSRRMLVGTVSSVWNLN